MKATVEVDFFATVPIRENRGQRVATGGRRHIQHPGYLAGILFNLMTPLILGSWSALIPALLVAGAYILRTAPEDRILQEELAGYPDYVGVRLHLLPGVW